MLELLIILSATNIMLTTLVYTLLRPARTADATPDTPAKTTDTRTDFVDSDVLTEYELRKLEEEAEFDLRIARMKDELAMRTPDVPRKGTDAPVLHPNVHNLPHHLITDYTNDLPDVEYTR